MQNLFHNAYCINSTTLEVNSRPSRLIDDTAFAKYTQLATSKLAFEGHIPCQVHINLFSVVFMNVITVNECCWNYAHQERCHSKKQKKAKKKV